ncbi:MAG TPA: hypothetical protein ENI73_05285 [Spirochaetes bacterium]|nr:hypothetical protein [Spirochaetota bacterium]
MFWGLTLILLGILAAPSLLLSKKPDAKEILDKITPYQGWIGVVFCIWGLFGILRAILNISILGLWPVWWITWFVASLLLAGLGFILGYGIISKYALSKNEEVKKKGELVLAKLTPIQEKLGLAAIIWGVWSMIAPYLHI